MYGPSDAIYFDLSSLECSKTRLDFHGVQGGQVCTAQAHGLEALFCAGGNRTFAKLFIHAAASGSSPAQLLNRAVKIRATHPFTRLKSAFLSP